MTTFIPGYSLKKSPSVAVINQSLVTEHIFPNNACCSNFYHLLPSTVCLT